MQFREEFKTYLEEALGSQNALKVLEGLEGEPSTSVRLNPAKRAHLPILDGSTPVEWNPLGFTLASRPVFTLHPLFHAGAYYVQDSSSMAVGEVFRRMASSIRTEYAASPIRILDLCAAPGGKTTDLITSCREMFGDNFILVANEPVRARAAVLAENVARWGDSSTVVTCADPSRFALLEGFFDIILADVPCSGEGMFRKDPEALAQWSPENVGLCVSRARRIMSDVWPALRSGGIFILSTCTFNKFENDGNLLWAAENLGADVLSVGEFPASVLKTEYGISLAPGFVDGEGQWCGTLRKTGDAHQRMDVPDRKKSRTGETRDELELVARLFSRQHMLRKRGDMLVGIPSTVAAEVDLLYDKLPVLQAGCAMGQIKGRDFVPDADLALCTSLAADAFPRAAVDKPTALAFLHKDNFLLPDAPKGVVLITYKDIPLGFVKNLGNRVNNLLPQGRRIRMDIK